MVGLLSLVLLSAARTCVLVQGEAPLREAALAAMSRAGVDTGTTAACAPLTVRVDRIEEDRIGVAITDASGRQLDREVGSPEMIAALVDSWTTVPSELMDLPERIESPVLEPTRPIERIEPPVLERVELPPPPPPFFLLSAGAEIAAADDGSLVAGPAIGGCFRLGWLCLDLAARVLYGGTVADASSLRNRRRELEATFGAAAEIDLGAIVLAPGLAVGAAWLHVTPSGSDAPIFCPPEAPCVVGEERLPPLPFDRLRPRAHATLSAFVPFGSVVALEAVAGATYSPLADDVLIPVSSLTFTTYREPRWSGRFALALRIGL